MIKWILLLIVIGLAATGWKYRDKVSDMVRQFQGHNTTLEAVTAPPATPNPATESVAKARKAYPALALANSPFNRKFVELYNNAKQTDPEFLAQPDWPMQLAARTANELASPIPTATGLPPTELSSNQLNFKPASSSPAYTVPPSVLLPGLKGSALDQRPAPRGVH